MVYSIRLEKGSIFAGYLSVKDRAEWKTKRIAEKHAKEFIAKFPEYTYTIEEN